MLFHLPQDINTGGKAVWRRRYEGLCFLGYSCCIPKETQQDKPACRTWLSRDHSSITCWWPVYPRTGLHH